MVVGGICAQSTGHLASCPKCKASRVGLSIDLSRVFPIQQRISNKSGGRTYGPVAKGAARQACHA